ncbi:MAG: pyrroline-5-carboxylate reductase [Clostridiales bacterium]
MNLGIIGAGNMGTALIRGILRHFKIDNLNIYVHELDKTKISNLEDLNIIFESVLTTFINNVDTIILAVKPKNVEEILLNIRSVLYKKLFISIASGIPIDFYMKIMGTDKKIVRVMPNTPALVGEGMTCISYSKNIEKSEKETTKNIFKSVGKIKEIDESLMDSIVSLSGSSPAYIFILIEAMADAAVLEGISRDVAYEIAAQTVLGSAKMVLETKLHPGVLKDQVCSPAGTTIEALSKLEEYGFRNAIIKAMSECSKKSVEISKKFKK